MYCVTPVRQVGNFDVVLSAWLEYHNGGYLSIVLDGKFSLTLFVAFATLAVRVPVPVCPWRANVQNGQNWTMARGGGLHPHRRQSPHFRAVYLFTRSRIFLSSSQDLLI